MRYAKELRYIVGDTVLWNRGSHRPEVYIGDRVQFETLSRQHEGTVVGFGSIEGNELALVRLASEDANYIVGSGLFVSLVVADPANLALIERKQT